MLLGLHLAARSTVAKAASLNFRDKPLNSVFERDHCQSSTGFITAERDDYTGGQLWLGLRGVRLVVCERFVFGWELVGLRGGTKRGHGGLGSDEGEENRRGVFLGRVIGYNANLLYDRT